MQYPKETHRFVAPIGTGGSPLSDAIGFDLTSAIPHLDTLEPLKMVVELIRRQTVRSYIIIVDTGSPPEVCRELEQMRGPDLEIHYVAAAGYAHASEPVAIALDMAQSRCRTRHLFHTHSDCFIRRRDLLESLLRVTNADTPVVGYRMSPREWLTEKGIDPEWRWMVGHTALMLYMPSIHRVRACWSFQHMHYAYGYGWENIGGWPDTETGFNRALRDGGIKPVFLGNDRNYERCQDDNIDHVRSFVCSKLYSAGGHHVKAIEWMKEALEDGAKRIADWDLQIAGEALHG